MIAFGLIFKFFFRNPLGQKIGLILACAIAFGLLARWYGNSQYYKGEEIGIQKGGAMMLEKKQEEWKQKDAEISSQKKDLEVQTKELEGRKAEVAKLRIDLTSTLTKIQATSQASAEAANAIVSSIPGDALDGSIRAKSAELGPPKTP